MKSRRKAREAALQALYQCDTLGEWTSACVDLYFTTFKPEAGFKTDTGGAVTPAESGSNDNLIFCKNLIQGVLETLSFVDAQISGASTNWSINRMCRVDRNILRLAVYEIAFLDDIPVSVSINEAIEIAKSYGTADSPMFINGVLDNVAGNIKAHPELVAEALNSSNKIAVNE